MAYNERRGPNLSEYIANLNAIPTAQEIRSNAENFNIDEDLAMFTNTQFFDFDVGSGGADLQGDDIAFEGLGGQSVVGDEIMDLKPADFSNGDFTFPDFNFQTHHQSFEDIHSSHRAPAPTPSITHFSPSASSPPPSAFSLDTPTSPTHKRKATDEPESYEDASRFAAEEDKRRRNTAASARFRVKKKQREQALERSAKEMSDKVAALEGRINQLETENKWLKNLVTEKNRGESKEDLAALWNKHKVEEAERKGSERKDGVGTKA